MRLSEKEPFYYHKLVHDYEYNQARGGWDYRLRDEDGTVDKSWTREEDTKRA